MTIKLVVSLGIFSYFADYSSINKLFDIIIPIYTILVLVVLVLFATFKPEEVSDEPVDIDLETPIRKAQLANAAPAKPVPEWKLKFFGTWDKLERTGFYDFMIFNGAPSFIAGLKKDSGVGNIIKPLNGDANHLHIESTGFPAAKGIYIHAETPEAKITIKGTKDPNGKFIDTTSYWDPTNKQLHTEVFFIDEKRYLRSIRWVDDEGVLHLKMTSEKKDGSTGGFDAKFRKTGNA